MKTKTKHILIVVLLIWLAPAISNALYQPIGIVKLLIQSQFTTIFSSTYDIATPAGSDSPSEADDRMRETKAAVQERLAVEHRFALTGTEVSAADTGEHTDITTDSIVNAGTMTIGSTLSVTGDFAINTDKFTVTATSGNTLIAGTLDITGNIDPTTYETTNGGFLDEDSLVSDAADKVASQQSIKAYVDNSVPTTGFWTADGTKVFDSTVGQAGLYQDLDISAQVGANDALVFLKVFSTNRLSLDFRVKGETDSVQVTNLGSNINQSAGASAGEIAVDGNDTVLYLLCTTNSSGILQWRASTAVANIKVFVIGFVN